MLAGTDLDREERVGQLGILAEYDRPQANPDLDYYPTNPSVVRAILERLRPKFRTLLDPGAGEGALGKTAAEWRRRRVETTAVELDRHLSRRLPRTWEVVEADFIEWSKGAALAGRRWDLVLTNPPFGSPGERLWSRWVDACRPLVAPRGLLVVLGFSNILASKERGAWWRACRPYLVTQLEQRPSYTGGGNDPRETLWFVWKGGQASKRTLLDWLPGRNK